MELDNLKELWNGSNNSSTHLNEEGLRQILSHSSRSPIALMKRNLLLEVILMILGYGFFIWLISSEVDSTLLYLDTVLFVIVGILFIIYARIKYKQLNAMECVSCEVKSNLTLQVKSLEKLVKLYFLAGNISMIFVYLLAGTLGYLEAEGEIVSTPEPLEILIFLSIGAVLALGNYFLGRWYLFTLYGKHINKLKTIIYEMDEN
jgi:hypothetical protein